MQTSQLHIFRVFVEYADKFPAVTVEIKVENRQRQPVVGLKAETFYMTENGIPVTAQKLEGSAYSNDVCDIVVVLDRSVQTSQYNEALETALKEIARSMGLSESNVNVILHRTRKSLKLYLEKEGIVV